MVEVSTKQVEPTSGIDPDALYTYAALAVASKNLSARKIRREVEEYKRMGHVVTGHERGKMVRGQQYLDWLDRQAVAPEEAV